MPFKRKRGPLRNRNVRRRLAFTRVAKTRAKKRFGRRNFASKVMRIVNNRAETKEVYLKYAENRTLDHNDIVNLTSNLFEVNNGTDGDQMEGASTTTTAARVGKRIYLKGVKFTMILESQQYRPNCSYWIYILQNRGNPDQSLTAKSAIFEGLATQIPVDFIDTEKVRILHCRKFTPKMPNPGTDTAMDTTAVGPSDGNAHPTIVGSVPNPMIIKKWWFPIKKYIDFRDGNNGLPTPNNRWQIVVASYNNNSTVGGGTVYPCGHMWLSGKLYFTDV